MPKRPSIAVAAGLCMAVLAACNDDGRTLRPARIDQDQRIATTTTTVEPFVDESGLPPPGIGPLSTMPPGTLAPTVTPVLSIVAPWRDGGPIDARFTCDGDDISPALSWYGVPTDAVQLAIAVTDDDAGGFVHWVVAGLAPLDGALTEGNLPASAVQAANDFSTSDAPTVGWRGPCPPPGSGPHTYRFTLFALNPAVELPDGSPAVDMLTAIRAASVASAVVTGTYER